MPYSNISPREWPTDSPEGCLRLLKAQPAWADDYPDAIPGFTRRRPLLVWRPFLPPGSEPSIVTHLHGVKSNGSGWMARCPGHDDQHASLSIGVGAQGGTLVNCFAGCKPEAVVEALDMTMADLAPPRPSRNSNQPPRKAPTLVELANDNGTA